MDVSGLKLTFDDEFNDKSISDNGPANGTRWTDHFFWGGNSGGIEKDVPSALNVHDGALHVTAENHGGSWTGGAISSVNSAVDGFSQQYGYFEMRAQMPEGSGTWPAFWLLSEPHGKDVHQPASELDVTELQGNQPTTDFTTMHSYATGGHWQNADNAHAMADTTNGYHTYGLDWNSKDVTWYVDGQQVQQLPTRPDQNVPMMVMANLSMGDMTGKNFPNASTPSSMDMGIDYIRVYSHDGDAHATSLGHVSSPDGVDTTPIGAVDNGGTITQSHATDWWHT